MNLINSSISSSALSLVMFATLMCHPRQMHAATKSLTVIVQTTPGGASITLSAPGIGRELSPPTQADGLLSTYPEVKIDEKYINTFRFTKEGFAPEEFPILYPVEIKTGGRITGSSDSKRKLDLGNIRLQPIRVEIPVVVKPFFNSNPITNAMVFVDGNPAGVTPLATNLVFTRQSTNSPWQDLQLRIESKPRFKPTNIVLNGNQIVAEHLTNKEPREVRTNLTEAQRTLTLQVKGEPAGADILLDDVKIGGLAPTNAPAFKTNLTFELDAQGRWQQRILKVQKENHEFREVGKPLGQPYFSTNLAVGPTQLSSSVAKSPFDFEVDVRLVPPTYVQTPVRYLGWEAAVVQLDKFSSTNRGLITNYAISTMRPVVASSPYTDREHLLLSRMAFVHKNDLSQATDDIVVSEPEFDPATHEVKRITIQLLKGRVKQPLTPESSSDVNVDPFVSKSGEWLYYSSDRQTGYRHIYRRAVSGFKGVQPITEGVTHFYIEPALSPDGERLAFVGRPVNAQPTTGFRIYFSNADGTGQIDIGHEGRSPAWSHDSSKLAFARTNELFVIENLENFTAVSKHTVHKDAKILNPVWGPGSKTIYFCTDEPKVETSAERHFDIKLFDVTTGKLADVISDASLDAYPMIVGQRLYFLSNRGAQQAGEESTKIYYIELSTGGQPK
jgi:hypothetical protein